jgi:CBS domain containing-hemolysin-like protein
MALEIVITLLLVLMNGFFVAAEFAIVKVRLSQIELKVRTGSKIAKVAKGLVTHLDAYLSATQLGITLASLGLGWIGEDVVAGIIKKIMFVFGVTLTPELTHSIAIPVAFIVITILHIVFGELAPKSLAIQRSEQTAMAVSLPLRMFYIVFKPFIWLLNSLANLVLKLLGMQSTMEEGLHSSEEIRYLLEEGTKSGVIGMTEHELLENVFEFTDTPIKHVMVPRGWISGIEISMTSEEILNNFIDEGFSRMPVYERTIDNIIGIIYAKDLISLMKHNNLILIHDIVRPAYFVGEEEMINKVMKDMQRQKIQMAIVLDEFGGTAGLVTMEDIVEEIVGEIQDEYDEESPLIEQVNENEYIIDASATIDEANDILPTPLPESEDYETVGGLIIDTLGRIPGDNEKLNLDGYECEIVKSSASYIETVKLVPVGGPEEGSQDEESE